MKILVADDDKNIIKLLRLYLGNAGYDVVSGENGSEAMDLFHQEKPDLVLLDVMMPVIQGWEVLQLIRSESSATPVIMLTSRDMVEDKVRGFHLGADDYIVKPFEPQEVLVRIEARLKKSPIAQGSVEKERGVVRCGNLCIDINKYEVTKNDKPCQLKPKEIQLLYFLMQNKNRVFSRDQLLEKVWEYDFMVDTRTVDVHIKQLRKVLGASESSWSIKTIWGVGYKFEAQ